MKLITSCIPHSYFMQLYIPLGSDETENTCNANEITSHFISHLVQMKLKTAVVVPVPSINFISHLVQMKLRQEILINMAFNFFISHLVQMKLLVSYVSIERREALYPTWFRWNNDVPATLDAVDANFISHLVQMKLVDTNLKQFSTIPLYPTWFRWNFCFVNNFLLFFGSLYIPLGSDETLRKWGCWPQEVLLYIPLGSDETHRGKGSWKRKNHLYIPLGSDETMNFKGGNNGNMYFISHLVQMKPIK